MSNRQFATILLYLLGSAAVSAGTPEIVSAKKIHLCCGGSITNGLPFAIEGRKMDGMAGRRKSAKTHHLPVLVEQDEDGVFIVSIPTLRGCRSYGTTLAEAMKNITEAAELCLEDDPPPHNPPLLVFAISRSSYECPPFH